MHLKTVQSERMLLPTLYLDWVSADKGEERYRATATRTKPASPLSHRSLG